MPGFNAQSIVGKGRSGNAVMILVGDTPVGFGQSSSHSVGYGLETFYGIGSARPQENQQLRYDLSVSLSTLQLTSYGLTYFGYSTTWLEILLNTELNISFVDNQGNPLITYVGCTARDYSSSIPANAPITEEVSFAALDVLDANGVTILNSGVDAFAVNVASTVGGALPTP